MKHLSIVKKAAMAVAVAAMIGLSALPGLAHADEGKGLTGSHTPSHAPVHYDTHELETVQFTFGKIS